MYIGICGPSGAGKDTLAKELAYDLNYAHVSGGDILRDMLTMLGLEPKKAALGPFSEFIREYYGVEPLLQQVIKRGAGKEGLIVTGIRSPLEARLIQKQGGIIIYVDADADLRYERIKIRARSDGVLSREEFKRLEEQENSGTRDTDQNLETIKAFADKTFINNQAPGDLVKEVTVYVRSVIKSRHI